MPTESIACVACRRSKIRCEFLTRFSCKKCVGKGKLEPSDCFLPRLRFYATDFKFKHAAGGGHEEIRETVPGGWHAKSGTYPSEPYYFEEVPFPGNEVPWAPFYYRKALETYVRQGSEMKVSPYRYLTNEQDISCDDLAILADIIQHRKKSAAKSGVSFHEDEKVLTCRRGILDLNCPKAGTFKTENVKLAAGSYRVRWRFQVYMAGPPTKFDHDQYPSDYQLFSRHDYNPMKFPTWSRSQDDIGPDYPSGRAPPTFFLSAGFYNAETRKLKNGLDGWLPNTKELSEVHDAKLDGALSTTQSLMAKSILGRYGDNWFYVESEKSLEVDKLQERGLPVFIVHCPDGGAWKGCFRFAGIELQRSGEST